MNMCVWFYEQEPQEYNKKSEPKYYTKTERNSGLFLCKWSSSFICMSFLYLSFPLSSIPSLIPPRSSENTDCIPGAALLYLSPKSAFQVALVSLCPSLSYWQHKSALLGTVFWPQSQHHMYHSQLYCNSRMHCNELSGHFNSRWLQCS